MFVEEKAQFAEVRSAITFFLSSGSSKEKNVGYVLEHLIGAMTVQKMIDAKKEECTPLSQDESEVTEVAELSTEEVCTADTYSLLLLFNRLFPMAY